MKSIVRYFVLLTFLTLILFNTASTSDPIAEADSLVKIKKYSTAFKLLDELSNSNNDPAIVIKKVDIALNYFVLSIMHQIFSFKDLEVNESIDDYRGKAGSYNNVYSFQIDSLLTQLTQLYPENGELYKYLGDFYYDVFYIYGDNWLIDYSELMKRIKENYSKAKQLNVKDEYTLHNVGVVLLAEEKYDESIQYFSESLQINETYPSSHYNLAAVYYKTGNIEKALHHSLKAFEYYEEAELKSDAARLVGLCYDSLDSLDTALKYFVIADKLYPNDYYNLTNLLYTNLRKRNIDASNQIALKFFDIDPTNPTIIQDILLYYSELNYKEDLLDLFVYFEDKYKEADEALGNIYFHKGLFYYSMQNFKKSLEFYELAREHFKKAYEADHYVFGVIDEQVKFIKEQDTEK